MNWKQLNSELRKEFGRNWYFFNDKNKYTRRIKICGSSKEQIKKYIQSKYPEIKVWEVKPRTVYSVSGVCFNMPH